MDEQRVRLLRIGSGGLLGIGKTKRLVPVEASVEPRYPPPQF
ncbi:hypothetical protein [Nocardia sp. CC201C]|nr:hypothetical protein [Nocardia sp. CC201C]